MNLVLRRIGLIGDVHAESDKLEAALGFLDSQAIDAILCTGDVCDGRGDVNRCCELLDEYQAHTVRGNHDRWLLSDQCRHLPNSLRPWDLSETSRNFLETLPATLPFKTVAGKLLLCHGVGDSDMTRLRADDYGYALESNSCLQELLRSNIDIMIGGHTHERMVRTIELLTIINAGTLMTGHNPCLATIDFGERWVQYHDFEDGSIIPDCLRIDW